MKKLERNTFVRCLVCVLMRVIGWIDTHKVNLPRSKIT